MLSLKVLRVLDDATKKKSSESLSVICYASSVCAPFDALHKSRCSTVNRIIYSNMLAFWLLSQLFQDKSNVVVQRDKSTTRACNEARCKHLWISSCLSNGPAEEGPLPNLPHLTTPSFFVKYEVYIWPMLQIRILRTG